MKDKNGRVLEIGDPVLIRGRVTHLSEAVGRNATVETNEVQPSADESAPAGKTNISISSGQIEYDESAGAVDVVANDDPAANPNPPAAADASSESEDNEAADDAGDEHAEGDDAEGKKGKSRKAGHGKRH